MPTKMDSIREEIRRLKSRRPFVPYTIVRQNGMRYEITRPFQVAFNDARIVIMPPDDIGSGFFRMAEIADVEAHRTVA